MFFEIYTWHDNSKSVWGFGHQIIYNLGALLGRFLIIIVYH